MIITKSAENKFKQLITNPEILPRIEIVAGGCNGFEKRFTFDNQHDDDIKIELQNGAAIIIDKISYEMLSNSTVDYKENLIGNFFSIEVPEATSNCGCGSSFSL
jgi:iron-sulfur cluster insertion protein